MLSNNQLAFLEARSRLGTDYEACEEVGVSPSRVSHWKKDNAEFGREYERVVRTMRLVPLESGEDKKVALRVLQKLEPYAEDITQSLLDMIMEGGSGTAKIQAIRLAYEILGLMRGDKRPEIGPNLQKAISALAPVYKAQLERDARVEVIDVTPIVKEEEE